MNCRERVNIALKHKEPDKIPISLGSTIVDGMHKFAKDSYESYLGLEKSPYVITHIPMGTVGIPESILKYCQSDFRSLSLKHHWINPITYNEDGSYYDEYGCLMVPSEFYYDTMKRPLSGNITIKDIERFNWPDPYGFDRAKGLKEKAIDLYTNTEYAIVADIMCGGPFEQAQQIRGFEEFLCDLYTEPELAEALMDKITEIDIKLMDILLTEVGEYVDIVCQGDDLAMQDNPFISAAIYEKYIKKYHKIIFDFIKSKTKAKIFLHCCGSAYDLIPSLIDIGLDILNPIQTSARNMEPERLKREFGKDICFWGGIDTQKLIVCDSPEKIEYEVRQTIEFLCKDGGYVIAPAHNIQPKVHPVNVDTMVKAAIKYRNY